MLLAEKTSLFVDTETKLLYIVDKETKIL